MISNSTCTLPVPLPPTDTKEAARPAGVGLSAQARIARNSLRRVWMEGVFDDEIAMPGRRSALSGSCIDILATDTGSGKHDLLKWSSTELLLTNLIECLRHSVVWLQWSSV